MLSVLSSTKIGIYPSFKIADLMIVPSLYGHMSHVSMSLVYFESKNIIYGIADIFLKKYLGFYHLKVNFMKLLRVLDVLYIW